MNESAKLFFMSSSTAIRLGLGLVTFAVMARLLGPDAFGRLMTAFGATALVALVVNFGMGTLALREIGAAATPAAARTVMSELMAAKLWLTGAVLAVALIAIWWTPAAWRGLFAWMLLAQSCDAQTDLLNVGFRATGRFHHETQLATVGALLQFGLVAGALLLIDTSPTVAAVAYAAARGAVMALTYVKQRDFFGNLRPAGRALAWQRIAQARPYAVDYGLQALFGQIDSVVLAHTLGPAAVGVYQAGMRLFMGMAQAGSVLGNVFIPKLASLQRQGGAAPGTSRAQYAFIATGLTGGLALAYMPTPWIIGLFGPSFQPLMALLPWFGLVFLLRFAAAMWGMLLTVNGAQTARAWLTALHWGVVAASFWSLLSSASVRNWLLALVIGNGVLAAAYLLFGLRRAYFALPRGPLLLLLVGLTVLVWRATP